jgi:hypothetical protein
VSFRQLSIYLSKCEKLQDRTEEATDLPNWYDSSRSLQRDQRGTGRSRIKQKAVLLSEPYTQKESTPRRRRKDSLRVISRDSSRGRCKLIDRSGARSTKSEPKEKNCLYRSYSTRIAMCTYVSPTSLATPRFAMDGGTVHRGVAESTASNEVGTATTQARETFHQTEACCSQCQCQMALPLFRVQRFSTVFVFCSMPCYAKFSATES